MIKRLVRLAVAVTVAFAALLMLLKTTFSNETSNTLSSPTEDSLLFFPIVYGPITPAGSYVCAESEYRYIVATEVITLNTNGSSIYAYNPPGTPIVTGTWVYTPVIQEVGFTNFRWLTATFEVPDRL